MPDGDKLIPFIRQYSVPSRFVWENDVGENVDMCQGEGRGTPPNAHAVQGQFHALVAVNAELKEGEKLINFLDNMNVCAPPERIGRPCSSEQPFEHQCIHHGKTKIWNCQGEKPECVDRFVA